MRMLFRFSHSRKTRPPSCTDELWPSSCTGPVLYPRPASLTGQSVSQSVFINGDIYRINKLTTTDKALYRFYVADKSVPPIYISTGAFLATS